MWCHLKYFLWWTECLLSSEILFNVFKKILVKWIFVFIWNTFYCGLIVNVHLKYFLRWNIVCFNLKSILWWTHCFLSSKILTMLNCHLIYFPFWTDYLLSSIFFVNWFFFFIWITFYGEMIVCCHIKGDKVKAINQFTQGTYFGPCIINWNPLWGISPSLFCRPGPAF